MSRLFSNSLGFSCKLGLLDIKDFYFTGDDYRYRFEVDAKIRFLKFLKDKFNSGVRYKDKTWKWDTIIQSKTQELVRFLLGKSKAVDFIEPVPILKRNDSLEIRKRILQLTQKQAKKYSISKSALHYLKKKVNSERPFKLS